MFLTIGSVNRSLRPVKLCKKKAHVSFYICYSPAGSSVLGETVPKVLRNERYSDGGIVCYTAVFRVVTQMRDDAKNGCVAD